MSARGWRNQGATAAGRRRALARQHGNDLYGVSRTARRLRNLILFVVTAGFIAFCVFVVVTAPKR
jgi:hypothetical protein